LKAIKKDFLKLAPEAAGTLIAIYLAGCSKRPSSMAATSEEAKAYGFGTLSF
jgi:hypothetical protein